MNKLKVSLKNCYGIQSLQYEFDFTSKANKAYAIYAPNGVMKTSFSKSFHAISNGSLPKEERYQRPSECIVESDGVALEKEEVYVVRSEVEINEDSPAITDILVDPVNKSRYDKLLVEINKQKDKLLTALQKASRVKKIDVEKKILKDWGETNFSHCIAMIKDVAVDDELSAYVYDVIFDERVMEVIKSNEFTSSAIMFNERYQELFDQEGSIYKKGIFNPTKAESSLEALDKLGFFAGGHKVHLKDDINSIDRDEMERKLKEINAKIDGDSSLKIIRNSLAKNAQTQALTELIEKLDATQISSLLYRLKLENQAGFRKDLWAFYVNKSSEAASYIDTYVAAKDQIDNIELEAEKAIPRWIKAVELFNDRFVDMPFKLSIANQTQSVLGKEKAKLNFTFCEGDDTVVWSRQEVKTLSQGEKRALYLLNFIFEVEARKLSGKKTIFIIDDVADSFDYKNKHAIVQYLKDLNDVPNFYQIILTHNFDFFRTVATNNFVHRDRCLMANRNNSKISLVKAEGVNNYFIGKWKDNIESSQSILCATIPFIRNLIEYTKGSSDLDYLKLTSLLHWKSDTDQITVGEYFSIYNRLFGKKHKENSNEKMKELIFSCAESICASDDQDGLNLEDKVVLSIAIRLRAEVYITDSIRSHSGDADYWCQDGCQFGNLMKEYKIIHPLSSAIPVLEKISITVSSNIHLNSFMYEPILDLTIDHLTSLYGQVCKLGT